ncbi:MAG: SRPBCC domain-containing protein [Nitrososphaerales archaeon]
MTEFDSQNSFQIKRLIPSRRERVFRAWTSATELQKWWGIADGESNVTAKVDLRVGGKFFLETRTPKDALTSRITGTFLEIDPPRKIVYTWLGEGPMYDGFTLVSVEFHEQGTSTEVLLTHEYFHTKKGRDGYLAGWEVILNRLAKAVESASI